VAEERPDLEEEKNQLIVSNAKMRQELKEIEDRILVRLSSSEGSPVDDIDLINTLEASKVKSQEIQVRLTVFLFPLLFVTRCYASAALAIMWCLSVCMHVRLCVRHVRGSCQNE